VGVVEVDLLNIRERPGTNYPILNSLAKGEKFYILGEVVNSTSNTWLLISSSADSLGWVIGDQTYVTLQKETVDLSTYLIWQKNGVGQVCLERSNTDTTVRSNPRKLWRWRYGRSLESSRTSMGLVRLTGCNSPCFVQ